MDCCKYDFGFYPHNADLVLDDLFADADGTYTVLAQTPTGSVRRIEIEAEAGDELIIPQGELNEDAVTNFQVLDIHKIPMEMDGCSNFKLTIQIDLNIKCNGNDCSDSTTDSGGAYGYS